MTGFARSEAALGSGSLICELRSVNHRFLEASLRLPEELRALEGELRARLQQELRRGKVDCNFTYRATVQGRGALEVDTALVSRLVPALAQLAEATRSITHPQQLDLIDLLRFPGVLREATSDTDALLGEARAVFAQAVTDLKAMRAREGARLAEVIGTRCDQLSGLVAQVRARLPEVHAAIRAKFAERLAELNAAVDSDRVEQEIVLMLQRLDVAEELDRLDGHLTETRKITASPEPAGRRLDFLMQELNREANTLSSKSQDLAMTRLAVDMKVLIEQMREQVQNVE
ncbi:MAG: YicC family protein [Nevskiaceae bacterium]|nr:YicC family protein [Nevskiaceae bacterium]